MRTSPVSFKWLFVLLVGITVFSCTENSDSISTAEAEEFAEEVVFRTQESTNLGRFGCYELVFPISLSFPDASSILVNSYDEMKTALVDWRKENPRVRTRPTIAFPYDVVNQDGEVITVENLEEQRALRIECGKSFFGNNGPKGHNNRPKLCFKPLFPFTVAFPDGTTVTLNSGEDRKILHEAVKAYKRANPGKRVQPEFVYPITVELEDGTQVTLNSREELKALIESCK